MAELYSAQDYHAGYPEGIEHHFWHRTRHDALNRLLRRYAKQGDHMLDVGCGMGIATRQLRAMGYNCSGVEMGPAPVDADTAAFVKTNQDVFALPASERESVDLLLLLDVIEHMAEPGAFMAQIREALPNVRCLVITVPARQEIWSSYDEDWGHRLRYNRPQLGTLLRDSGYQTRYCAYHYQALYLAALAGRALAVRRRSDFAPPQRTAATRTLHAALAIAGYLENRLAPGWLAGSSLFCVAEARR